MRRAWLFPLLVSLVVGSGAVTAHGDGEGTFSYADRGYAALDPARVRNRNDERLVHALYECLTLLDPRTGEAVPGAAERWEEAADGRSWTFHLRSDGTWSDGSPVTAEDFVASWKRAVDPYEPSSQVHLFRPLRGCARIRDEDQALRAFTAVVKGLRELTGRHADRIPGDDLRRVVAGSGVRPFVAELDDPAVKRLLRWGSDPFPTETAKAALEVLRGERRRVKDVVYGTFDAFGKEMGAVAKDDRTLVVLLDGYTPWLPLLVARAPFAPLHARTRRGGDMAFEPSAFLCNGAYRLQGRGPKPRPGVPDPESVVHLVKRDDYAGPRPGVTPEILCYTGLDAQESLRRFLAGELQWIANPGKGVESELEGRGRYVARPTGSVLLMRLRCDRPPFDRLEIRRAFAQAVERSAIAAELRPDGAAAERIVPPEVAGAGAGAGPRAPRSDAAAGRRAIQEAGLAGDDFPWVELRYPELPEFDDIADALLKQFEKALGVELGVRIETVAEQRDVLRAGAYELAVTELWGEVADPATYLSLFHPKRSDGGLGWEDEAVDGLLTAAGDLSAFLEGDGAALDGLPGGASLRASFDAAKRGGGTERERFRRALLAAVEA
ncbi:MAG: ABC transporter substrate-binding protein, partial [Planctomycetota bacterium]